MKRLLLPAPVRKATRGRFDALTLAVLAVSQCRGIAKSVERGLGEARHIIGDPRARNETKAMLSELTSASRRARELGLTKALNDKFVARHVSRASRHASNALDPARVRRRRRPASWRPAAMTFGAGLVAGSAHAAWRTQAKAQTLR